MSELVRTALSSAASSVEGIHCTPYFRQSTKPGDAMVRFDHDERDTSGMGFMTTWQVVVMLPQDVAAAEKFIEAKRQPLIEALSPHLVITRITPQQIAIDSGTFPVLFIEGARETEEN